MMQATAGRSPARLSPKAITGFDSGMEHDGGSGPFASLSRIPAAPIIRRKCAACSQEDDSAMSVSPKLEVGAIDDPAEREADAVADRVMAGDAPSSAASSPTPLTVPVARAKPAGGTMPVGGAAASAVGALGGGKPMPASDRAFFEPRLGQDLSHVRLHDDPGAEAAASSLGARAFTIGSDIVFGRGEYGTDHTARHLLAHELAHVQQNDGVVRMEPDANPRKKFVIIVGGERALKRAWKNFLSAAALRINGIELPSDTDIIIGVYGKAYRDRAADPNRRSNEPEDYLKEFRSMVGSTPTVVELSDEAGIYSLIGMQPAGSISRFEYFGHGLAGKLAVGYDYDQTNIDEGVEKAEIGLIDKSRFASNSVFISWACNTSTVSNKGPSFSQEFATSIGGTVVGASAKTDYSEVTQPTFDVTSNDEMPFIANEHYPAKGWQIEGASTPKPVLKKSVTASLSSGVSTTLDFDSDNFVVNAPEAALIELSDMRVLGWSGNEIPWHQNGNGEDIRISFNKDNTLSNPEEGSQTFTGSAADGTRMKRNALFRARESGEHFINLGFTRVGYTHGPFKADITVRRV